MASMYKPEPMTDKQIARWDNCVASCNAGDIWDGTDEELWLAVNNELESRHNFIRKLLTEITDENNHLDDLEARELVVDLITNFLAQSPKLFGGGMLNDGVYDRPFDYQLP